MDEIFICNGFSASFGLVFREEISETSPSKGAASMVYGRDLYFI